MHIAPYDNKNIPIVDVNHDLVPLNYFNIVKLFKGENFKYRLSQYESCIVRTRVHSSYAPCSNKSYGQHFFTPKLNF